MTAAEKLLDRQALDRLIRLADVPKLKWLPRRRGGTRLAVPTIHRWANPTRTIHLRTVRVGGCRCTTEAWLREFFAASGGDTAPAVTPARTPARRQREHASAERQLQAAGIL